VPVLVPVPTIVPRSDAAKRRLAAQHWGASKAAESLYVLAIGHIMSAAHNAVLRVVQREHLASGTRQDADKPRGLNGRLLHDIVTWQKPRVSDAFSKLAKATNAKSLQTAALYGVHVRHEAGIEGVIETARAANVALVTNATADFLDQIRQALEEHEGETSDEISAALQDRVGVSKSRGTLIARTETLKLNSQVVEHRARSAGAYTYRWSTSLDERVRPMHADLEDEIIHWDNPPVTNDAGDLNHAGRDFQCRCVPVVIVGEEEEEPEGEEPSDDDEDEAAE